MATGTERAAELATVDNGDGTWSYALPDGFDPDALMVRGALTWQYDGQARFSWDPQPKTGPRSFVYTGDKPAEVLEQLAATSYNDAEGRRWVVAAIDESLLTHDDYLHDADLVDAVEGGAAAPSPDEYQPEIGDLITWEPMSWTDDNCDGLGDPDYHIWDGESRSQIGSPNLRQKAAVRISTPTGSCSGVMLRSNWVLTANHCVYDASGLVHAGNNVDVFLDWNSESKLTGSIVFPGPNFAPSTDDYDDDYALIKLPSAWSGTFADFDISSADDNTLQAVGANFHNVGFPGWFPACSSSGSLDLVHSADNDVTFRGNEVLRWKGDGTIGHSGGPVYFCPDGDDTVCAVGDDGYVVAVFAGWNGLYSRFVGPRGSNFSSWATNIMNIN